MKEIYVNPDFDVDEYDDEFGFNLNEGADRIA